MDSARVAVRSLIALPDHRTAFDIGRRARLELRFVRRRGRTVLAEAYAEPPFRIGRCFSEGEGVHMIMASSAPGVFGGDWLEQVIHVDPGATVRLDVTVGGGRFWLLLPDPRLIMTLRSRYIVAESAALTCVWDPADSLCRVTESTSGVICARPLTAAVSRGATRSCSGRGVRGERWQFASPAHELGMWQSDALGYLERYCITPPADHSGSRRCWIAADACYFGTILVSRDELHRTPSRKPASTVSRR